MPPYDNLNLDKIGTRKIVNGQLVWTPPSDIEPTLKKILQNSVDELNRLVKKGTLKLDKNGDVTE